MYNRKSTMVDPGLITFSGRQEREREKKGKGKEEKEIYIAMKIWNLFC